MPQEHFSHLRIERYQTSDEFENPKGGDSKFRLESRVRAAHAAALSRQFNDAVTEFEKFARQQDEELYDENIIYLEFESAPGFKLDTDRFDDGHGRYKLTYSRLEKKTVDGEEVEIQKIGVLISTKGVRAFLDRINEYAEANTKKGQPRHQNLVVNIDKIRAATLKCFWTEIDLPFPEHQRLLWWEVWLRRDVIDRDLEEDSPVKELLIENGVSVGRRRILLPEHIVVLARGTADQLSRTLLLTDKLAELRKPRTTAEFFLRQSSEDQHEWIEDLMARLEDRTHDESVVICLLDTGVNRGHRLLLPFLPSDHMYSVDPSWDKSDTHRHGHGTQMAGNALYGDLAHIFPGTGNIEIFHRLESVKLLEAEAANDPKLYGALTIDAASQPVTDRPQNPRVYCLAITAEDYQHQGEPSSWSSAIDELVFGTTEQPNKKSVFLLSGGNVYIEEPNEYDDMNILSPIHDPAQSFNAISIGAFTDKDDIDPVRFPGARALAARGSLSPFSSTGIQIQKQWANKPDVVFEGGNLGVQDENLIDPDSLKLLSTGPSVHEQPLSDNYATSAATALASRFAAELYSEYPAYWPETIRGLIVHSARWSDIMKAECDFGSSQQKINLLRKYGYGIPDVEKARYSASDRLTLIAERQIQPFCRMEGKEPKINEYHVYELPWPKEVLRSLFDETVRLNITLSYFIEPNPGKRAYSKQYLYQSAGLRFKSNRPGESLQDFTKRINKKLRDESYESEISEEWCLGSNARDRGSIHRDWCEMTATELADRNLIAIFPVTGWWKTRKKFKRYTQTMRYSLIVSIDSPDVDLGVDLYTPVRNQIELDIRV